MDRFKWLLPLIFVVGYFITFKYFDNKNEEFLIYNLLATFSCVILLTQIKLFEQKFVAVWMALILVLWLYFIRFYWVTIDPLPMRIMLIGPSYSPMVMDRNSLLTAFQLSVMGFASFCISAATMIFFMNSKKNITSCDAKLNLPLSGSFAMQLLTAVTLLMLALAYVSNHYHIGEMGAISREALPFRLRGVIFYSRTIFIPLVILLSIYLAARNGLIKTSRLGILILITHAVIDMLLRNSRSTLLLVLLLLLFLFVVGGIKLQRKEKIFFGVAVMLAFFMTPIMTEYRRMRVEFDLSYIEAFSSALSVASIAGFNQLYKGLEFIMFRMPGIENLWNVLSMRAEPLGIHIIDIFNSKDGVAGYLSHVIHNLPVDRGGLLAPGFLGWLYFVAGIPAIILGSFFTSLISVLGWGFLDRRCFESGPIPKVFFLWVLFLALTEGTLDSMGKMFLVGLITIVTLEFGLRIYMQHSNKKIQLMK